MALIGRWPRGPGRRALGSCPQAGAVARTYEYFLKKCLTLRRPPPIHRSTDGDDALGGRLAIWFSRVSRALSHLTVRLGKAGPAFRGRKSSPILLLFDN